MPILMHQMRFSTNFKSPFSDAQVEKMEIREQERQSEIILIWKALNKEKVMFYKPIVAEKTLTWSKFYSDSSQRKL